MVIEFTRPLFETHKVGQKLSEYDYTVEHCPGTRIRHADALFRSVNMIGKDLVISK